MCGLCGGFCQEEIASGAGFGQGADGVGKGKRSLLEVEFFEGEGHGGRITCGEGCGMGKVVPGGFGA